MLRVLHYIPGFLYGGIESMFLSWYKNIDHNEVCFELLIRTQDDNAIALREYRELGGVYYRLPVLSPRNVWRFKSGVDSFFREHHDYDILHVHSDNPFIVSAAHKYGIHNIVEHSHAASTETDWRSRFKNFIFGIDTKISRRLYVKTAFACSRKAAEWKFGGTVFKGKTIHIINNAIEADKYDFNEINREKKRTELNLKNIYTVIHIGRMTYQKNQFYLLDIFSELLRLNPDSVLLLIGDGPDEPKLVEYAKTNGIYDRCLFLGTRDDVCDLLQAGDCFLLPSRWEGLPVTAIEAQAAGLPCFISDAIAEETDITNNIFRLSINESPSLWAAMIEENRKNYHRVSCYSEIVRNGFDIKTETRKLIDTYNEIVICEG